MSIEHTKHEGGARKEEQIKALAEWMSTIFTRGKVTELLERVTSDDEKLSTQALSDVMIVMRVFGDAGIEGSPDAKSKQGYLLCTGRLGVALNNEGVPPSNFTYSRRDDIVKKSIPKIHARTKRQKNVVITHESFPEHDQYLLECEDVIRAALHKLREQRRNHA